MTVTGATISDATVTGATITGATITGAHISGASISGATFSGDTVSGGTIAGGIVAGGTIDGGTVSGGTIAGGTITGGIISPLKPEAPPAQPPRDARPPTPQPRGDPAKRPAPPPAHDGNAKTDAAQQRGTAAAEEDDEELAARALRHLLVQRGALLLPIWGLEVAPGMAYTHTTRDTFVLVPGATEASPPTTLGLRRRSHQVTGSLGARLGLPWDFQVEASLPAIRGWGDSTIGGSLRKDQSGFGIGDPRFTLTWQALRAGSLAPDLFLAATYKPRIGSSPFEAGPAEVGLGTGYPALGATVTAVKTSDPLVLLANVSYTANLAVASKQGRRDTGDTWGLGGGAILAVSPETSMSFLLDLHYKPEDSLRGKTVLGSDEISAVLQLGLGTVLSRNTLLNVSLGVGLTADAPDLQLALSVPLRFY